MEQERHSRRARDHDDGGRGLGARVLVADELGRRLLEQLDLDRVAAAVLAQAAPA